MRISGTKHWWFMIGAVILMTSAAGCSSSAKPQPSRRAPLKIDFWVDQSDSVCAEQRVSWEESARKILGKLGPDDVVEIFEISDVTAGAAPLFREQMPHLSDKPLMSERIAYLKKLAEFAKRLEKAIKEAFAGAGNRQIRSTDIFSVFSRFEADDTREGRLFVFTDGLHVDAKNTGKRINMETMDFAAVDVRTFIKDLFGRYRWSNRTLERTNVLIVLPDAKKCPAANRSNIVDLQRTYAALIQSLGGNLHRFETFLTGGEL